MLKFPISGFQMFLNLKMENYVMNYIEHNYGSIYLLYFLDEFDISLYRQTRIVTFDLSYNFIVALYTVPWQIISGKMIFDKQ